MTLASFYGIQDYIDGGQKSTYSKGTILWIGIAPSRQKIDIILENIGSVLLHHTQLWLDSKHCLIDCDLPNNCLNWMLYP